MAEAYAWADIVVHRVGERYQYRPNAVDDHQTRNGEHMVKAGAAILIPQQKLTSDVLAETLKDLAGDRKRILTMAQAARSLARPDATERVVNYCLEAANG